jgi:hypothetical protein
MNKTLASLALLAAAPILSMLTQTASAGEPVDTPMFAALPAHGLIRPYAPGHRPAALLTWNGSFTYNNRMLNYTMVGTAPQSTNTTTTITVYVIPVRFKYDKAVFGKNYDFDPNKAMQNGVSVTQNLLNSPLFNAIDWQWGSLDMGTTQYEDAFQRGSFWGSVGATNTAYHVIFAAPQVLSEQTIKITSNAKPQYGNVRGNPFGPGKIGELNINYFDKLARKILTKFPQIDPSTLPLFLSYNIYLDQNGIKNCCIGGYHSADNAGQTYAYATYVVSAGAFSEDIDAWSHELGEWLDDPFVDNNTLCGGILEVGDPLENLANYGTFPVTVNGVTWHPQALTFISYFGDTVDGSANGWLDNQNLLTKVCQYGQ